MKLYKVLSLIYLDSMIFRNAKWKLMEYLYFPISTVIIWGLFSIFVKDMALEAGLIVLVVNIFWTFAYLAQSTINMQMNEDLWSGSIKQILVTGITEFEYLVARVISSVIVSVFIMIIMLLLSYYVFGVAVIGTHMFPVIMLSMLTLLASVGLAIFVAAAIFLAGVEYAFLGWSIMQVFMLFSAPFYPVTILPVPLQSVASVMPFTAIFENIRHIVSTGTMSNALLIQSIIISVTYTAISILAYYVTFRYAKRSGRMARMS